MIKLVKSTFHREDDTKEKLINFIRRAKQLSFGPECVKFENNFAVYQDRKHAVFLNSGSSANFVLIQALLNLELLRPGDQIGFSTLTWSTNVMPIIQLGLVPVPIDVEIETLNVSSRKFLAAVEENDLKAFFLTNLLGFCDDVDRIKKICRDRDIVFLEDNCEALGSEYRGRKLGNWGLASTFSFFVGHHISTIEGGAVCTDDRELAAALKIVRAHGWDRQLGEDERANLRSRHQVDDFYGSYTFYQPGYNFRPTEINGFIGNRELLSVRKITRTRHRNFIRLARHIYRQTDKYLPIRFDHMELVSNFAVPVVCRSRDLRERLVKRCQGVLEVRPIVGGDVTRQPFFNKYLNSRSRDIVNAKLVHEQGLYFANNPHLTEDEIRTILPIFSL